MRNFICIYDQLRHPPLNMRQLLNPIFFQRDRRHPDHKRQRCSKLRAKALRQAREYKARYIPLCHVPLPATFDEWEAGDGRWVTQPLRPSGFAMLSKIWRR